MRQARSRSLTLTAAAPAQRAVTWPASLGLHAAGLSLLLVVPLLRADAPPEPLTRRLAPPLVVLPPPPPAGGGGSSRPAPPKPPPRPAPEATTTFLAPTTIPELIISELIVEDWGSPPTGDIDVLCAHCAGPPGIGTGPGQGGPGSGIVNDALPPPPVAPLRAHQDVRPPEKLRHVDPEYPDIARRAGIEGIVIIECTIDASGRVVNSVVLRGRPLLDEAALSAVRQWVYRPTLLNGIAVPVIMTVTVNFDLG